MSVCDSNFKPNKIGSVNSSAFVSHTNSKLNYVRKKKEKKKKNFKSKSPITNETTFKKHKLNKHNTNRCYESRRETKFSFVRKPQQQQTEKKITHQFNNALKRATFWFGDRWSNFVFFSRLFSTFFTLSSNENPFVHFVLSFIVNVVRVQNPYTIYNIFDILSSFFLSAKRIIFWARVIYLPASIHILWFCVIPIPVLDIISFGDIYTQYTAQYTHR